MISWTYFFLSICKEQLKNNDEQVLLENLERRWVNSQQNNFVSKFLRAYFSDLFFQSTKEFIASRVIDCAGLQSRCRQHLKEVSNFLIKLIYRVQYNQIILERLKNNPTQPF